MSMTAVQYLNAFSDKIGGDSNECNYLMLIMKGANIRSA